MRDKNSVAHYDDMTEPQTNANTPPTHTINYNTPNLPAVRSLYAIIDSVTDTIIGGIQLHLNAASAIRTLFDIASGDTMINKHPLDFDLWLLGSLTADHRIKAEKVKLISGPQIEAYIKTGTEQPSIQNR